MRIVFFTALVLLTGAVSSIAADATQRDSALVRFKGGIGVIPVSNVVVDATTGAVTVNRNVVRGVNSPGQIWRIENLEAEITDNGDIAIEGVGLLLGGGNGIATNAGQSVAAQLFCGDETFTSPGVALEVNGNFNIAGTLDPSALPEVCDAPALLIRSINLTTGVLGSWLAAGIPRFPQHDRRS